MSTLHKVKAYFGMAPMEDYDDEYYDDRAPSRGFPRQRFDDGYGRYEGRDYDDPRGEPATIRRAAIAAATPTNPRFRAPLSSTAATWAGRASGRCAIPPAARWRWIRAGWR